jgi:NTE family protein
MVKKPSESLKPQLPSPPSRDSIYLALGGGAARGFAHLGVLQVLEEEGISIAGIAGSSMGALIGGLYALYGSAEQVTEQLMNYIKSPAFERTVLAFFSDPEFQSEAGKKSWVNRLREGWLVGRSLALGQVVPVDQWQEAMEAMIPDRSFSDCSLPFFATALDLTANREVVFFQGNLRPAIMASCAIPGVFPGVDAKGHHYLDGGWIDKVPVRPLKSLGATTVLGVDVSPRESVTIEKPALGLDLILKSYHVVQTRLDERQKEEADFCWTLPTHHIHWADFKSLPRIVALGRDFARRELSRQQRRFSRPWTFGWHFRPRIRVPSSRSLSLPGV